MKTVNRFEAKLLQLLHAILQHGSVRSSLQLVHRAAPQPACLSRNAVELIKDALRKGSVHLLARHGGWQRQRYLRKGQPKEGRLWERTAPSELGLKFSRHSLAFLVWTTAVEFEKPEIPLRLNLADLTIGDHWLLFSAYDAFRATDVGVKMRSMEPWANNALCWLMFPEDAPGAPTDANCDFRPWVTGQGACVLEALQPRLTGRWIDVEQQKTRTRDSHRMQMLGQVQHEVLNRFHSAVEGAQRLDLTQFELTALQTLVHSVASGEAWISNLDTRGLRMADRQSAHRAACAFLEQADRLRRWEREARSIGFFEDEYPAAQLWQSLWERAGGDELLTRTHALIREIEPLHA